MAKIKNEHYVNNKEMIEELRLYKKTGIVSEKLGVMFFKIASKYATRPNFCGYSYKDDMVSDALSRMMDQATKFNVDHPSANPFAYFTMVVHRQFLQTLKKEKKDIEIKRLYREKIWSDLCIDENLEQTKEEH